MKRIIKTTILFLCTLVSLQTFATEYSTLGRQDNLDYIEKYKRIAIREMHRTKIPASIKLAQGILESAAGKSELARKANNHFGIKCGGSWNGKSFKKKDDDYKNGRKIKSCFRAYANPEESFVAHSEFLTNPRKSNRYGFLFDYKPTDYKKWAKGLKKAGYATNPKYPKLLINLIEDYKLHRFDKMTLEQINIEGETTIIDDEKDITKTKEKEYEPPVLVDPVKRPKKEETKKKTSKKSKKKTKKKKTSKKAKKSKPTKEYGVFKRNDVKAVLVQKDDTPQKLAQRHHVKMSKIIKYNELIPPYNLKEGTYIYLQPKRSSHRGKQKYHLVKDGETMYDISQRYGVKLNKLLKRNKMKARQEAATSEKIILRGKRRTSPRLKGEQKQKSKKKPKKEIEKKAPKKEKIPANKKKPSTKKKKNNDQNIHVVQRGETLYRLSKKYNVTVDDIKKWNNLKDNSLEVGQELIIKDKK